MPRTATQPLSGYRTEGSRGKAPRNTILCALDLSPLFTPRRQRKLRTKYNALQIGLSTRNRPGAVADFALFERCDVSHILPRTRRTRMIQTDKLMRGVVRGQLKPR